MTDEMLKISGYFNTLCFISFLFQHFTLKVWKW